MGLLKGTLSFVIYRVDGDLPVGFRDFADRQLKRFAFQELLPTSEKSLGWTSLENPLDTAFSYLSYAVADYFTFLLRVDRRLVPPALLRIRTLEREKKVLEESRRKKLYKNEREDIRDAVFLSCLSQTPPTPSFSEICWNLSEGRLLFGGSGKKILEDFEDLFRRTFEMKLRPWLPWDPQDRDGATVDKMRALPGETAAPSAREGDRNFAFLGKEFLSWLWFKSEERGGTILLPGMGDIGLIFVRKMVLSSGEGEYAETVTRQGMHADLREGKAALREGKMIREARIRVDLGSEQWEFTLKAETFRYQTLRLPVTVDFADEEESREGRLLERIQLVETLLGTMEKLFDHFLSLRLSPRWETEELKGHKKWLAE